MSAIGTAVLFCPAANISVFKIELEHDRARLPIRQVSQNHSLRKRWESLARTEAELAIVFVLASSGLEDLRHHIGVAVQ
jgi:hypothetical protein